ncbi:MAG: endonuclease/exonuclease/phosphatase family protein [Bacteroidales bacterium]|nr:endonuclease/exonuclease/phosphatase family protein [Bacteroidales bacterium]
MRNIINSRIAVLVIASIFAICFSALAVEKENKNHCKSESPLNRENKGGDMKKSVDSLKVMTYNLRYGELASLDEIASQIKRINPDFVALQEVDVNTHRKNAAHQNDKNFINSLGFLTGMFAQYGKAINFSGGYYGIGVLSKYPIIESKTIRLPNPENTEQRVLLQALCEIATNDTLMFVSTHIDYTNEKIRMSQIDFLSNTLINCGYNVIVGGDFNSYPDSPEIINGMSSWTPLTNDDLTFPSDSPTIKIDYLFGYPKDKCRLIDTSVVGERLSDHCPIVSEVEIKK